MQSVQAEAPAARNQTRPISPEHGPRHTHNSAPHVNINARLHSEKQINMRHAIKTDLRYHNYAHLPTKAHTNALSPTCRRGQPRVCSQDRRKIDKTDIRYQNYAHTTTHTQTRFEQRANTGRPEFAVRVCCCPWLGRVRSHRDSRVCLALYRIFRNHLSVMSTCLTVFCRDHDNLSCPCSFRVRMPFVTTRLPAVTRSLTSFYLT